MLPGFSLVYGGPASRFSTFEVGIGSAMYLNLELRNHKADERSIVDKKPLADFGRVIFYTRNVDSLYRFMQKDRNVSQIATFESEPADAPWGERYFHVRDPDGYELSFARPILAKD